MKLDSEELVKLKKMIALSSGKTIERYERLNPSTPEGLIVFAGDSMIEYMDLETHLPGIDSVNRGVAGATTDLLINNFDKIFGELNPTDILISIGSNDLVLKERKVEDIITNISKLFEMIIAKFPFTTIYYLSTTPVIKEDHPLYKKIYIGGRTNDEQKAINEGVKKLTDSHAIMFINLYDSLTDENGYLKESFTPDGIHLNHKGYKVYSEIIRERLRSKILCSN